jgi:hypothetical protein
MGHSATLVIGDLDGRANLVADGSGQVAEVARATVSATERSQTYAFG